MWGQSLEKDPALPSPLLFGWEWEWDVEVCVNAVKHSSNALHSATAKGTVSKLRHLKLKLYDLIGRLDK